jgi:transposase InsO family protein
MTEGGSPLDNAVAESFFATLKKETAHGARDNARRRAVYAERREAA